MEKGEYKLNKIRGKRVCITGATGMVGGELFGQLTELGATIRVVVRNKIKFEALFSGCAAEVVECELTNPIELKTAFEQIDIVYNCAAQVSFKQQSDNDIIAKNTDIATHVVNACIDANVKLLVHVSSIAALGSANESGVITEKCFPENIKEWSGYGISKYYSENEVWKGSLKGLPVVIVNPSVILGEGDWNGSGSSALFATLACGLPFYTAGVMGYVDVRDVALAMIDLSLTPEAIGKRFILSADNVSYRDLITMAAESTGKRTPLFEAGLPVLNVVSGLDYIFSKLTGRTQKFTRGVAKTAVEKSFYNDNTIKEITGFEYTPIKDTIDRLGEAYKNRKS